jgi:hypothetical protein
VNRVGRVNFNPGIKHVLLLKPIYINTSDLLIYHNTKARSPLADVHPYYNNLLIPHTSVLDSELHTTHRSHHVGRISLGRLQNSGIRTSSRSLSNAWSSCRKVYHIADATRLLADLSTDLEWKLTYVGSATSYVSLLLSTLRVSDSTQ